MLVCRRAGPADLPALRQVRSRWDGPDYVYDALPAWLEERPGGVYLYEVDGRVVGFASIAFPKPGEAWLRGKRIDVDDEGRGFGTRSGHFELAEAVRLGARVVRLATAPGPTPATRLVERLGFERLAAWTFAQALDAGPLLEVEERPMAAAVRPRRLSAGQWHNARVRLAVQLRIERSVPASWRSGGSGGGQTGGAAWGLIAVGHDPWQLASFGPFDLVDAFQRGEVVTAGDPARPAGVMLLCEPEPGEDRPLLVRHLVGSPPAQGALLAYAAERARARSAKLALSLAAEACAPLRSRLEAAGKLYDLDVYQWTDTGRGGAGLAQAHESP
ncbi:MAG TPA: GNAT family N-acetyltransferase [Bacillota bacterium]